MFFKCIGAVTKLCMGGKGPALGVTVVDVVAVMWLLWIGLL